MPTLVLAGDRDPFFSTSLLQETAAAIPDARLVIYDGVGHGLTKLHKRRFEEDVLSFLTAPLSVAAHRAS
jgi:pimeloyl-ACP methyl ester carboxylesterase